ncbi:PLAC8 family-domain-containing protein [Aspergillus cavernicola]|uniref:PLAC8 family-domain-containing protein n=1 Tax=Aspergillus cavernicola TaxID=176166 RepID=A0ABR4HQG3_9EURO
MNPQLRLDTSDTGLNQRYSFIATPHEMTPPNQPRSQGPLSPAVQHTYPPHHLAPINVEKTQYATQNPGYIQNPNIQQHPAHYAPYADYTISQQAVTGPSEHYAAQPSSPGPLPLKTDPNALRHEHDHQSVSIAPDSNPLQSPKIPYFPPPVRSPAPQEPAGTDLAAYHRPGQISHPNQEIIGGGWSHGLCDCTSIGTCCLGFVCPCILYGRTQHRLSMRSRKEDPTNMLGYETCNGSCTAMALLCGCQWLMATIQHTRTRKAYAIPGSIASDCVRATCCTCCTLIQDEKEIRTREEERAKAARAAGATLVSPYLTPVPMSYGPPPR